MKKIPFLLTLNSILFFAPLVNGDILSPSDGESGDRFGAAVMETVEVGFPGNAPNPGNGFGAVPYVYEIGTFEVTNAEYAEFLNAVDPQGGNALGLFNPEMESDPAGGIGFDGTLGEGFYYYVKSAMANTPVNFVSILDAARFANWMTNGRGAGDTEEGAYRMADQDPSSQSLVRSSFDPAEGNQATREIWALPTFDEWYKAAYYEEGENAPEAGSRPGWEWILDSEIGGNYGFTEAPANYWLYPTRSDEGSDPLILADGGIAAPGANLANTNGNLHDEVFTGVRPRPLPVGSAGSASASFFGTRDQGGNVSEFTETWASDGFLYVHGGNFGTSDANPLWSLGGIWGASDVENSRTGFRLVRLPEVEAVPEIAVSGDGEDIVDGDTTPRAADGTDFGSVFVGSGPAIRTFRVSNPGTAPLTVSVSDDSPRFSVSGLTSPISAGGFDEFTVTYDPSVAGTHTATIRIDNNDADENPFTFAVRGEATVSTEPAISVSAVSARSGDEPNQVVIDYDFEASGWDAVVVSARVRTSPGGHSFKIPLRELSGDVGFGVQPGPGRRIVWDTGNGSWFPRGYDAMTVEIVVRPFVPGLESAPEGFALIEPGIFVQGSPPDEAGRLPNENQREVTIGNAFWMGETEVTAAEAADLLNWALDQGYVTLISNAVVGNAFGVENRFLFFFSSTASSPPAPISPVVSYSTIEKVSDSSVAASPGDENRPVTLVTRDGVLAYAHLRSLREGLTPVTNPGSHRQSLDGEGYRLPTEAEWEYACRAGTTTPYYSGSTAAALAQVGWYAENAHEIPESSFALSPRPAPVGLKAANPWGLRDMHGNVAEWVYDYDHFDFSDGITRVYPEGPAMDPVSEIGTWIQRGGSYQDDRFANRSAYRGTSVHSSPTVGIRLARTYAPDNRVIEASSTFSHTVAAPDIRVEGNGVFISDHSRYPSADTGTLFAMTEIGGPARAASFVIQNLGNLPLEAVPSVTGESFSLVDAGGMIQPGSSRAFQVRFAPVGTGMQEGLVTIQTNDPNEDPYAFRVEGPGGLIDDNYGLNGSIDTAYELDSPGSWLSEVAGKGVQGDEDWYAIQIESPRLALRTKLDDGEGDSPLLLSVFDADGNPVEISPVRNVTGWFDYAVLDEPGTYYLRVGLINGVGTEYDLWWYASEPLPSSIEVANWGTFDRQLDGKFRSERYGTVEINDPGDLVGYSDSLQSFVQWGGSVVRSDLYGTLRTGADPQWLDSEFFGWTYFGLDYEANEGWVSSARFGWMKFFYTDGGPYLWVIRDQHWVQVNPDGSFLSFAFGPLTPISMDAYASPYFGTVYLGDHGGWFLSSRFGWVWAVRGGDGRWFYSSERGWLGLDPNGSGLFWSVDEGRWL